ncbi:unnamed protein product [Parajaminaea phylloscopi]
MPTTPVANLGESRAAHRPQEGTATRHANGSSAASTAARAPTVSHDGPTPMSAPAADDARVESNPGDILCKWWKQGYCNRGDSCWFRHYYIDGESCEASSSRSPTIGTRFRATALPFTPSQHTSEAVSPPDQTEPSDVAAEPLPEQPPCAICFELPATYGLLENCDHAFCLSCIRAWRDNKEKDPDLVAGQINKACPACRQRSHYVTPSSAFHIKGPQKDAAVTRYKAVLASKPCKFFEESKQSRNGRLWCPFGDDCHYRHTLTEGDDRYTFGRGASEMLSERRNTRRLDRDRAMDIFGVDLVHTLGSGLPRRRGQRRRDSDRPSRPAHAHAHAQIQSLSFDFDANALLSVVHRNRDDDFMDQGEWYQVDAEDFLDGLSDVSDWSDLVPSQEDPVAEPWDWVCEPFADQLRQWMHSIRGRPEANAMLASLMSSDADRVREFLEDMLSVAAGHYPSEPPRTRRQGEDVAEYRRRVYRWLCGCPQLQELGLGSWRVPASSARGSDSPSPSSSPPLHGPTTGDDAPRPSNRSQRRLAQRRYLAHRHRNGDGQHEGGGALPSPESPDEGYETVTHEEGCMNAAM